MVLPLRDDGAISLGLSNLPGLFMGSLALTLIAAPISTLIFSLPNLSKGKVCILSTIYYMFTFIIPSLKVYLPSFGFAQKCFSRKFS